MSGGGRVGVERRVGKVARFGWGPVGLGATGLANGLSLVSISGMLCSSRATPDHTELEGWYQSHSTEWTYTAGCGGSTGVTRGNESMIMIAEPFYADQRQHRLGRLGIIPVDPPSPGRTRATRVCTTSCPR
jgi:hypothetical protein